jgi:hypothetical protein
MAFPANPPPGSRPPPKVRPRWFRRAYFAPGTISSGRGVDAELGGRIG